VEYILLVVDTAAANIAVLGLGFYFIEPLGRGRRSVGGGRGSRWDVDQHWGGAWRMRSDSVRLGLSALGHEHG
jgi:hypothetical protein